MLVYCGPRLNDRRGPSSRGPGWDGDNSHCAESALHGLGHWHGAFPKVVEGLIDGFLATHSDARPELLAYARSARCGYVL
jgi:hypothetical protein